MAQVITGTQLITEIPGTSDAELNNFHKNTKFMYSVSKEFAKGSVFKNIVRNKEKCHNPLVMITKEKLNFILKIQKNPPCDDNVSVNVFDGIMKGVLFSAYIDDHADGRGYHIGKFGWETTTSKLIGKMSGVSNACTHRIGNPQGCSNSAHMEGRLEAVIVSGEYQGCHVEASYLIWFDLSEDCDYGVWGTLEGVLIGECRDRA